MNKLSEKLINAVANLVLNGTDVETLIATNGAAATICGLGRAAKKTKNADQGRAWLARKDELARQYL